VDEAFKLLSTCKPQHSSYLAAMANTKAKTIPTTVAGATVTTAEEAGKS
jgi:hypothetical protein